VIELSFKLSGTNIPEVDRCQASEGEYFEGDAGP